MNSGQEQFFYYIVACAKDNRKEKVKGILEECFEKQDNETFTIEFLNDVTPKILATLKDEYRTEVKAVMNQFGAMHISK